MTKSNPVKAAPKENLTSLYKHCTLCPRACGVSRLNHSFSNGFCGYGSVMRISRIAPHLWEEPFLSGQGLEATVKGSGTVFFCGCNLGCVYCQNHKISRSPVLSAENGDLLLGRDYSPDELADEMLRLQELGVHNINLVTAVHFLPSVVISLELARKRGLTLTTVYNSSGYEKTEALRMLDGLIDVYLPDFKYLSPKFSEDYSSAADYPDIAKKAINEMFRQTGKPLFDSCGFMLKGTAVRHLILPGCDSDSQRIVKLLFDTYGNDGITLSLMNQYTPRDDLPFPELTEPLPYAAYLRVIEAAQALGFRYLYTQQEGTASESFIREFT